MIFGGLHISIVRRRAVEGLSVLRRCGPVILRGYARREADISGRLMEGGGR